MLNSVYPNESVRWDRVIACLNKNGDNIAESSFVMNFSTENFLMKHEIDSAFVVLKPYSEENIGDNRMSVFLLKEKFSTVNNWNNKPIVNSEFYAVSKSVPSTEENKVRIDVSNLVKYQSKNYKFNLPLIFDLYNDNLTETTFASFYSTNVDIDEVKPKLEVYYK
ncbi:DNRLRE domain-containing protein [Flavobacterium chuncheonense]|uniref:DNRLRE domain-containing protein n=1 Tax=Flavobacterium chuncheonense TaxID=2026653 RepID=A0ABW5YMG0_9FLAO